MPMTVLDSCFWLREVELGVAFCCSSSSSFMFDTVYCSFLHAFLLTTFIKNVYSSYFRRPVSSDHRLFFTEHQQSVSTCRLSSHEVVFFVCLFVLCTISCELYRLFGVKISGYQQFLKYSNWPIWHQEPCKCKSYSNHTNYV